MRELSLFTGAGGGILGSKLLGWETIGYVEWEKYCQQVLIQRIKDGLIDDSPIFGDIREFNRTYARGYQGMVDVITAGFPCQPFSVAGKGLGADDPRNMWPATLECIRIVRPQYAFLENVPGLLSSGYVGRIFGDLSESGYDARQGSNIMHKRALAREKGKIQTRGKQIQSGVKIRNSSWWVAEPNVDRVVNGMASKLDRTGAIGNGQVPAVVRAAWELLSG